MVLIPKARLRLWRPSSRCKESEVLAYAIGIDINPNARKRVRYATYYYMLNKWAAATGGRVIRLVADESSAARNNAQLLLEELRHQYTLSYYPTVSPENTGWRNIEVRLSRPGTRMRYRTGYFTAAEGRCLKSERRQQGRRRTPATADGKALINAEVFTKVPCWRTLGNR